MRSPQYQLEITKDNIHQWMKKIHKDFNDLATDEKYGDWTYFHLVNLEDDLQYLLKFLYHYDILKILIDTKEGFDGAVAQSAEAIDSKSV